MAPDKPSRLSRPAQKMPDFVKDFLVEEDLLDAYKARPAYQQNDYLGWINRAKQADTRARRLGQMLEELRDGKRYMNAAWKSGD